MKRSAAMLLATLMLALALPAPAQTKASDTKAAAEKFKRAQKRYDAKDYAAALELSRAALDATGSPNARLYVARSLRELSRLDEAYAEMQRTLSEATQASKKDAKYEATRDSAAAELALLDQKVGKLIVALVDAPPGARIELNGNPLESHRIGVPVAVSPGDIVLKGAGEGAEPVNREVKIAAGETKTVTLVFKPKAAQEAPESDTSEAVPVESAPAPSKKSGGALRTAGYVTVGVGAAGFVVFAVAGAMANSKYDELEKECGKDRCTDPKYADTVDSGKRMETISNVGLVVGALGVIAGGTMILLGGPKAEKTGSASVAVTPDGWSLGYSRRF